MPKQTFNGVVRKRHREAISIYPAQDFYVLERGSSDYRLNYMAGNEKTLQAFVNKHVSIKGDVAPGANVLFIREKADISLSSRSKKPSHRSPKP